MAALESVKAYPIVNACTGSPKCSEESHSHPQEIIKPSIVELTKEVRTNILCTVEGCGKILPNTPALNMHLVKSHRVKDGLVNPTVRKDMKGSQKLYCCPIEGCPRGPNRPFSQFSLVKQHFMKMHAEKKHKCSKCNNGYSTEWDLRRHTEDCGKTYRCTCGCPYASRAALLSHVYRTGHEVPNEHRHPPVKKRKMEKMISAASEVKTCEFPYQVIGSASEFSGDSVSADRRDDATEAKQQTSCPPKTLHKLLLPKPKVALVNMPVMQLAHLPFLLPSTESGALRSVMLTVDSQGSFSTIHLLPQSIPAVGPHLDTKTLGLRDSMSASRSSLGPTSTGVQANLEPIGFPNDSTSGFGSQRGRSTSTNIQTDMSYLSSGPMGVGEGAGVSMGVCSMGETSVSSCAQTDISVGAQVLLPVSVETQTFPSNDKVTSTIGAQTESHGHSRLSDSSITRQTQTQYPAVRPEERVKMGQAIMCSELFDSDSLSVSTQTALHNPLPAAGGSIYDDEKDVGGLCFGVQTDEFHSNSVADNQTQTMALIHDLENILSGHQVLPESPHGCGPGMGSVQEHNAGIDFDFEEFLNAVHIQTQTEESELGGLGADTPLESLDIQTQTDFLLLDGLGSEGLGRSQPSDLDQEMFDTQTQTDLNFLLNTGNHIPLGNILRQSSFSMSTESSDTETQTELQPLSPGLSNQPLCSHSEQARILSSSETQTSARYSEALGHLFLTSNETQTVMDDFLCADMAWNMESHLSSVETQTCEELFALFQQPEKPNS